MFVFYLILLPSSRQSKRTAPTCMTSQFYETVQCMLLFYRLTQCYIFHVLLLNMFSLCLQHWAVAVRTLGIYIRLRYTTILAAFLELYWLQTENDLVM